MQATLTIQDAGDGGLDAAFAHTFDTTDPVVMACMFARLKAELSRQVVDYTWRLTEDQLEAYRGAELLAAVLHGNKQAIDANLALWEDGR